MKPLLNTILITLSLAMSLQALGFGGTAAVVKFDLSEGWIQVEPKLMNIGVGTGASARNKCIGLCFNFGDLFGSKQRASVADSANNTYFFLLGNPDDLYLALFSFACAQGKWLVSAHTAIEKIRFTKGEIKIQGHLATNRQIVAPVLANSYPWLVENLKSHADYVQRVTPRMGFPAERPEDYVNELCTADFQQRYAAHRLSTLATVAGENDLFSQKFKNNKIYIQWDAANYLDKLERRSYQILDKVQTITESNSLHQEPVTTPEKRRKIQPRRRHGGDR